MSHAGFCVVASVGIVTLASACASRQKTDGSATAAEHQSTSEAATTPERPTPDDSGTVDDELAPASGHAEPRAESAGDCPMQMSDARLSALPAMGGIAFLFTTERRSSLDELRRRALALHDAYARGLPPVAGPATDLAPKTTIETSVDYVDERDGARVEIRAIHQNDVDELRRRLRSDTTAMADHHRCPALGGSDGAGQGRASHEQSSRR